MLILFKCIDEWFEKKKYIVKYVLVCHYFISLIFKQMLSNYKNRLQVEK